MRNILSANTERRPPGRLAAAVAGFALLACAPPAIAQTALQPLPLARPYGMTRPLFPLGRPRSLAQPRRSQRLAYYDRQISRLRRAPQTAAVPFGVIGGLDARMARFRSGSLMYPDTLGVPAGAISRERRQAFRQYGGFRDRTAAKPAPGDVTDALRRRYDLPQASSHYAPVQRANLEHASVAGLRTSLDRVPLATADTRDAVDVPEASRPTLAEELARAVELTRDRKLEEAWTLFGEGEYRKALRAFETVAGVDREDREARLGELFSALSLGSTRAALAMLAEFARREPNPFLVDVDMANRYGRREEVMRLTLQARSLASAGRENAALVALATTILWHLEAVDEARSAVRELNTIGRGTVFENWPEKLEAARSAG